MFSKLVIATGNINKYHEFEHIVRNFAGNHKTFAREIIYAPEIAGLVVEETGRSYSENAMLKAEAWAEKTGLPCLADDSGLEVKALDGAPGIFSARVVPGDNDNKISWLLSQMQGITDRKARFVASLALAVPNEYILICEGYCYGKISSAPSGINGFGYDPVFIPDGYDITFAEITSEVKNSISHRTNAFRKIIAILTH